MQPVTAPAAVATTPLLFSPIAGDLLRAYENVLVYCVPKSVRNLY